METQLSNGTSSSDRIINSHSFQQQVMSETLKIKNLPSIPGTIILWFPFQLSVVAIGVRALSRHEVKKDLYEIEYFDKSDSDSSSSVLSEDIIASSYPVKPRRHPKARVELKPSGVVKDIESDQINMEETIEFLRLVETVKPEIYEAEKEREILEIRYQVWSSLVPSQLRSYIGFARYVCI